MSQQNNQDIDKDSEDRISALEAAVWMHSKGKGQAHLIDAAKGRLRQYHHIYRKALADAIRRPMGVIPDSAIGLVDHADMAAAERRREAAQPAHPVGSGALGRGRMIYELIDATDYETHWTLGIWPTKEEAIAAVDARNDDPNRMTDQDQAESCTFEIRERQIGWCDIGETVWTRSWVAEWNEDGTDYVWRTLK